MALGAMTLVKKAGAVASAPVFCDLIQFAGDGQYGAGGTVGFQALMRAKLGDQRTVLAIVGQDCGGYVPVYDLANDKLKVYEQGAVATSPLTETQTANLAGVTFNVLVISK